MNLQTRKLEHAAGRAWSPGTRVAVEITTLTDQSNGRRV